jgi:hypothetical protein
MNRLRPCITTTALIASIVAAKAQSFNIDLDALLGGPGVGQGQPSPLFGGAAQQIGVWNAVECAGPWTPTILNGLNGLPTTATIVATGGIGSGGGYNLAGLTGDFALLMKDFADIGGEIDYHISGLRPGMYSVYCYAVNPAVQAPIDVSVTVPGANIPIQHVTGPMLINQFLRGTTHTVHDITLTGNSVDINVAGPWPNARVNGFQIVETVPEPVSISIWALGLSVVLITKRRRSG